MYRITISVLLAIFVAPGIHADTLDEVLDDMVEVYGGEAVLRKADCMTQEWELVALRGSRHGRDRRSVHIPGRLRVELTYPHKSELRVLNGEAGMVVFDGTRARMAPVPQRDSMRLQMMRLYSPLALRDRIGNVDLARVDRHWVLTLREFGLRADFFVDAASYRIDKVVGYLSMGGGEMTFVTEYSDFNVVDGILVHHRENKFAGGTNTAVLRLREVRFDVEFSDSEFQLPEEVTKEDVTIARN